MLQMHVLLYEIWTCSWRSTSVTCSCCTNVYLLFRTFRCSYSHVQIVWFWDVIKVVCFTIDRRRPSNVVRAAVQELSQSLYSGSHIFACLFAYMFSVYCVQYIRAIKIYSISLLLYLQVIVRSQCNNSYLVCVLCCFVLTSSSLSLTTVTLDMLNKRKQ